ncbi:MAG: hypothetical protein LBM99_05750, partial [Bacillales bacterium]|nr:hypothetical protein [Bacillales bacterium]
FNFTQKNQRYFNYNKISSTKELFSEDDIEYVHGTTNSNIIFGIDSQDVSSKLRVFPYIYKFTKQSRKLHLFYSDKNKAVRLHNVLADTIENICFYGHSLNKQDFSYFQTIFDHYDLYNNKKIKLFFFYSKGHDNPLEVSNLLLMYQNYLSSENKKYNVLSRLQLENRIFSVEVNA